MAGRKKSTSGDKPKKKKSNTIPKPKLKAFPNSPKITAPLKVWVKYQEDCAKVSEHNRVLLNDYQAKLDARAKAKQLKEEIKDDVEEMKKYKPKSKLKPKRSTAKYESVLNY